MLSLKQVLVVVVMIVLAVATTKLRAVGEPDSTFGPKVPQIVTQAE